MIGAWKRIVVAAALVVGASAPGGFPAVGARDGGDTRVAAAAGGARGGYWLYAADGGVFAFGDAAFKGTVPNQGADIAGMAVLPSGEGYWLADDDGDVFPTGSAGDFGSRAGQDDDIAGFAARPQGDGYWMVSRTGTLEAFGAAPDHGSVSVRRSHRIATLASTPSGSGYWMSAIDGGVFALGDAGFFGSMGGTRLNQPIVAMAPTPSGKGYWLAAADGGLFTFGDARFFGSMGATPLVAPIVGMAASASGLGYWLVAADGGVFAFGDAPYLGSMGGTQLNQPVRGMLAFAPNPGVGSAGSPSVPGVTGTPGLPGSPTTTTTRPGLSGVAPVTFVGAGDIASCSNSDDEATAKLLDGVVAGDPGATVFTLGDNVYNSGTDTQFTDCYGPTWGRHRARTRPVVGNHEYGTAGAGGYFNYFGPRAGERGQGYYSYDVGAWHVVVLNSQCSAVACGAGSAQERWLRADLAASAARCTVALWHHPRFNSGAGHGSATSVAPFWEALYQYGADVVLAGHEHLYERFGPQRPDATADAAFGLRQFTVGTGGKDAYSFGPVLPNSEKRSTGNPGVLKLTLRDNGYDWNFLPVAGKTFTDSGSGTCHGQPAS